MLTPRLSLHPYMDRLPPLGAIVEVHVRPLQAGHRYSRWEVVSYPGVNLHDCYTPRANAHLVNLEALHDRRQTATVSGFWCEVIA